MATTSNDIRMAHASRLLAPILACVLAAMAAAGVAAADGATQADGALATNDFGRTASVDGDGADAATAVPAGDGARAPSRSLGAGAGGRAAGTGEARPLFGGAEAAESKGVLFGEVLPTAAALGATLLAIVLARGIARRFGGAAAGARGPSGVVQVLARYPLARGQQVVLLEVGRRILVTHQTAQSVTTLSEFSDPAEVADLRARCEAGRRGIQAFSFDALLRRSSQEFDAAERSTGARSNAGRGVARAPEAPVRRGDVRSVLPEAFRSAEIETVDLTRQGARR